MGLPLFAIDWWPYLNRDFWIRHFPYNQGWVLLIQIGSVSQLHRDNLNTINRDVFSRDEQREMGVPYTRSRYYHLYINGQYWGIFQTQERSEADFAASYFGGDPDDWDTVKSAGSSAGYTIEATDGTLDAWQDLWNLINTIPYAPDQQTAYALFQQAQGNNPDGTRNPQFPVLLDVDNLAQYMRLLCS